MKTLEEYFREQEGNLFIDHALRIYTNRKGELCFYIHPANKYGPSLNYTVEGNTLTPYKQDE